jgi:hypothetical protein
MRISMFITVVLAGCGVVIDDNGNPGVDAPRPLDAKPIDAPPVPDDVAPRPCTGGDVSMMANGSCFLLFTTPRTHAAAAAECAANNTHLAYLKTPQDDTVARTMAGTRDIFIGLTDQLTEGTFRWGDGEIATYTNWYPNEPNDAGGQFPEDCALINGVRGGRWDDRPCAPISGVTTAGTYGYLCQF